MNKIIFLLAITILTTNCFYKTNKEEQIAKRLEQIYFKQITFSKYYSTVHNSTSPEWDSIFFQRKKILVYIDSTGCTDCRIHDLRAWKNYMEDINYQADLIFIFQTKDLQALKRMVNLINLDPKFVFYDTLNTFEKQNAFLKDTEYNTFLLDKNNHILLIGTPLYHTDLWNLYKKQIIDHKQDNQ